MNSTISVIIPVYNVSRYLRACLDSVLTQSYADLQVILIDDGSTDSSGAICDAYAAKDSRVTVIHQKNGGAAAAKNAGLRVAVGKYLSFVDGDDYLEPGAYFHMVSLQESYGADAVQCAYRDVFVNQTLDHPGGDRVEEYDARSYMRLFPMDWTCGLLWNKLYVRTLFDDIFFEEGHKIDDEYFTYQGMMNAKKIVRDNVVVYNYRKRRSSVMRSAESGKQIVKDRIDYLSKRRVNVIARFPELRRAFDCHFVEMMVILSRDPLATKESNTMIKQQLKAYFKEVNHTPVDIRLYPALLQLWCGMVKKAASNAENTTDLQYFD